MHKTKIIITKYKCIMNKYIVGLDIGTTKIACFIGEGLPNGKIRIAGFGKTDSVGVERGVVKNIIDTANSIRHAVQDAAEMAKCEVDEVYVGIAGQHIKSRPNQGSVMIPDDHHHIEKSDVERLIDDQRRIMLNPGEEIIHVFPQTYEVDGEELGIDIDPVGVNGKRLSANFHIVTGQVSNIRNIRDAVLEAGLKIKGVVLEPIASAFAVLDDTDKTAGVTLVDIGGGTTDIAIFYDGIIRYTNVLPLAGDVITNDIKNSCKIMRNQAECLKVKFGSCLPSAVNQDDIISIPGVRNQPPREVSVKTLATLVRARTEMLLEQVGYEIEKSGCVDNLIAGVVLTGGGAKMQHIKEFAELMLGIDCRIGTPDEHVDQSSSVTFEDLSHPMYATGIGLVIYGLNEARNEAEEARDAEAKAEHKAETKVEEPVAEPVIEIVQPEEQPQNEPETSARKKNAAKQGKGTNLGSKIATWLTEKFTDKGLDE